MKRFTQWLLLPFLLVLTDYTVSQTFTRITSGPIGTDMGASRSVTWVDVNNDGFMDLFVTNGLEAGEDNTLYLNNGPDSSFSFRKITSDPIVEDGGRSDGSSWGDIDNDGDLDAFVVNWYGDDNLMYRNNGDGTFVQAFGEVPVSDGGYSETCSWGDMDSDGFIDLYVTNSGHPGIGPQPNSLYRNLGNGQFEKIITGPHVTDASYSRGASWVDYDADSDLDLYVTNERNQANHMYQNMLVENGSLSFEQVAVGDHVTLAASSWSASWADFDNDGDEDLFVANGWPSPQNDHLFTNNGDGSFSRETTGPVVTDGAFSACAAWGDYDNDGDLDLFVTTAYSGVPTANRLYQNRLSETGSATFEQILTGEIVTVTGYSYGTAWEDYTGNGFLDLFVARTFNENQENLLFRNDGENGNHWIRLRCEGTLSNRSSLGTRIRVKAMIGGFPVWQTRSIVGQTGYCGQSLTAHFGLGDAARIDSLMVYWPSGMVDLMTDVAIDSMLTIQEGHTLSVDQSESGIPQQIRLFQNFPNPFNPSTMIRFELPEFRQVRLDLFDILGRHVTNLVSEGRPAGVHSVQVHATVLPSSGVYTYRLVAGDHVESRKLMYLR